MYVRILHLNPGYHITWSDSTCQSDSLALVHSHNAVIIWNSWKIATKITAKKDILNESAIASKRNQNHLLDYGNLTAGLD